MTLFFYVGVGGQSLRTPVSSTYQLVNAYSVSNNDVFSFTKNTAALAHQDGFSFGAFAENRFSMKEINQYSAVAGLETGRGNFGIQADYFGYTHFNEYQLGLAYARTLGKVLDIGAQFNYYAYRIPAYGQNDALTFELGLIAHLSDVVNIGLQVYNPVGGYLSKEADEKLAAQYQFGVSYEPSDNVIVSGALEKEEKRELSFSGGVYYQFHRKFFARAGIKTAETMPFAAAGIALGDIRIDVSVSHHPQLGFSPGLRLIYNAKMKRDE